MNKFKSNQIIPAATVVKQSQVSHVCDPWALGSGNASSASINFYSSRVSTLCYYITYLSQHFNSPHSIWNYISGVMFMHKELCMTLAAVDSFHVTALLRPTDISPCVNHPLGACPSYPVCCTSFASLL